MRADTQEVINMVAEYKKVLPVPNIDTQEFWDGCHHHELLIQKCSECGIYRFYPCPMCSHCGSMKADWKMVSGKGTVYTWSVIRRAADPAWAGDLPYIAAVIELDEQPSLLMPGNIVECDPDKVTAGMSVEVFFEDVTEKISLPKWRPASTK